MSSVRVHPDVLSALAEQRPVVGLESAVITHGLPKEPRPELLQQLGDPFATKSHLPVHLALAEVMEESVRKSGAIPATTAVIEGELVVGLTEAERHELAHHPSAIKAAPHRLSTMIATKATGGTTVGGALTLLHRGHPDLKVLATGGIGGVHRGWTNRPDISADLIILSRTPLMCVCAGAKIVLDAVATFEALETLGIPVLGCGCSSFPRFHAPGDGTLPVHCCTPQDAARVAQAQWKVGTSGILVTQAPPEPWALELETLETVTQQSVASVTASGPDATPALLGALDQASSGQALLANLALLRHNALLASILAAEHLQPLHQDL
ncbi:MAG: pseudouridine-5'-phosphate glycosidase [Planctomycetota bacterium]|nr:pseudouridine-5'-phosphate glycosidase [Planctomycetota bacterium]